jgi:uncharacterized protein YebE (UPF0316 family)
MEPFVIMALVLCEVALWQWRVAITLRGNLFGGFVLGLVGAILQVTAISRVVQDMGNFEKIAGYAAGVAIGVLLGCLMDRHLSTAEVWVRVIAPADPRLVPALRTAGWPVTATSGQGHEGPVDVLYLAIDQRRCARLEDELRGLAPKGCWTIERISGSRGLLTGSSASARAA